MFIPEETEAGQAVIAWFNTEKAKLIEEADALRNRYGALHLQESREKLEALLADWRDRVKAVEDQRDSQLRAIPEPVTTPVASEQ